MIPFAVCGLQLELSAEADNTAHIAARVARVMELFPFVQMVVVSELAAFGPSIVHAQPLPGPAEDRLAEIAAEHGIWLLPGTLFECHEDRIYNTASVIAPNGQVVARHRKLFPFLPYETEVDAGSDFCVFDVPEVGRFGVLVCYDIWFPETSRTLAAMGVEVILHPVMTTTIDREIEIAITRAAAATNQAYVVSVNGARGGGNGRSVVCGPNGDVLFMAGENEQHFPIELDLDQVRRGREVGIWGLGQPLKSFRDRAADFRVYERGAPGFDYLEKLGPLAKQQRGAR
jgi:predicted amidohydrolase